ncbi:YihY/virulence factor BrkB family protein [Demequina aurantiaca]|uniref:YihY/virulence factor BrkB family protein n=1 Tax=Demequina aurantiaca TaxID=676200 RepID=UPI003D34FA7F
MANNLYRIGAKPAHDDDAGVIDKGKEALADAKTLKGRFDASHAGRMLERMKTANGNVLAGGIAYYALTSLTAAFVIAITISSYLVRFNENWNDAFFSYLDDTIPGIVKTDSDSTGLVDPSSIEPETLTGLVGVISLLVLINTATRYLRGLRLGTRAMLANGSASPVKGKLRDFIALFSLVLLMVLGMVLQLMASRFASAIGTLFADQPLSGWAIRGPAFAAGVIVDMAFVALVVMVLGHYVGPRRPLVWTLLVTAIAIGLLRQGVSWVVGSAASNPVLGSATAIITVMIFVYYVARIILYAGAWLGTLPRDPRAPTDVDVMEMEPNPRRAHGSVTTARATTLDYGATAESRQGSL